MRHAIDLVLFAVIATVAITASILLLGKWVLVLPALPVIFLVLIAALIVIENWLRRRYYRHGGNHATYRRVQRGRGLGLAELARRLDRSEHDLREFTPRYRSHTIAKRSGGTRQLHVPDAATASLQLAVLHRLLKKLRVHDAACGFERGRSIVHNAQPHVGQAVVIKMDIIDFFPTTSVDRIRRYFQWVGWDREAADVLTNIVTHEDGLPQGAPTSPRVSNLVNYYLDEQLVNFATRLNGRYTRYADDITFSFAKAYPSRARGVVQKTRRILKSKGYELHGRKTRIVRHHQQQRVTGLVVNDRVNLPRATRRRLRAIEHRLRATGSATMNESQLAGWRALQRMIASQRDGERQETAPSRESLQ